MQSHCWVGSSGLAYLMTAQLSLRYSSWEATAVVHSSGAERILAEEVVRSGLIQHGNVGQGSAAQEEGIDGD